MSAEKPQIPRAPAGMGKRARSFWRQTLAVFELTTSEILLLEEICRSLDTIDALREAIEVDGVTVAGSEGQTRAHPGLVEVRQQRVALGRLLSQLALPDEDGTTLPSLTTARARKGAKAANSRWRSHRIAKGVGHGPA